MVTDLWAFGYPNGYYEKIQLDPQNPEIRVQ